LQAALAMETTEWLEQWFKEVRLWNENDYKK
jgi:hypothetical protein